MVKTEKQIEKFFKFIFNEDVSVEIVENDNSLTFNIFLKNNFLAKQIIYNILHIKKILDFYIALNKIEINKKYKITVKTND